MYNFNDKHEINYILYIYLVQTFKNFNLIAFKKLLSELSRYLRYNRRIQLIYN
jgi:hypothetical protein